MFQLVTHACEAETTGRLEHLCGITLWNSSSSARIDAVSPILVACSHRRRMLIDIARHRMGCHASRRGQGLMTCWPGQVGPGQVFGTTEPAAHLSKRVAGHGRSAKAGTRDLLHPSRPRSASAMQSPPNRQPSFDRDHSRPRMSMSMCGRDDGGLEAGKATLRLYNDVQQYHYSISPRLGYQYPAKLLHRHRQAQHSSLQARPRFVLNKDAASPQQHPDWVHCRNTKAHLHYSAHTHTPTQEDGGSSG